MVRQKQEGVGGVGVEKMGLSMDEQAKLPCPNTVVHQ